MTSNYPTLCKFLNANPLQRPSRDWFPKYMQTTVAWRDKINVPFISKQINDAITFINDRTAKISMSLKQWQETMIQDGNAQRAIPNKVGFRYNGRIKPVKVPELGAPIWLQTSDNKKIRNPYYQAPRTSAQQWQRTTPQQRGVIPVQHARSSVGMCIAKVLYCCWLTYSTRRCWHQLGHTYSHLPQWLYSLVTETIFVKSFCSIILALAS